MNMNRVYLTDDEMPTEAAKPRGNHTHSYIHIHIHNHTHAYTRDDLPPWLPSLPACSCWPSQQCRTRYPLGQCEAWQRADPWPCRFVHGIVLSCGAYREHGSGMQPSDHTAARKRTRRE